MKSNKERFKKYINELSLKDLINHIVFYLFFGLAISLYDWSFVCRLITWFFDFIIGSSILFLICSPKFIVDEVRAKYKKQNPLRNGINELISLIFVSFLTYNEFWFTLTLFIMSITLIATIFSCKELTKKESKNENR